MTFSKYVLLAFSFELSVSYSHNADVSLGFWPTDICTKHTISDPISDFRIQCTVNQRVQKVLRPHDVSENDMGFNTQLVGRVKNRNCP